MTITQQMGLGVFLGICGLGAMWISLRRWDRNQITASQFLAYQVFGVGGMGAGALLVFIGFVRLAL